MNYLPIGVENLQGVYQLVDVLVRLVYGEDPPDPLVSLLDQDV